MEKLNTDEYNRAREACGDFYKFIFNECNEEIDMRNLTSELWLKAFAIIWSQNYK